MAYFVSCIAVLLVMTIPSMNAFSNGPPLLACDNDLLPRHGVDPTDNPLPFFVNTNEFIGQTYIPNQLYRICLHSELPIGTAFRGFRGFMIQGRTVASDSATGSFIRRFQDRPLCNGNTATAHNENGEKFNVSLLWRAPPPGTGAIRFRFTFVERFVLFWRNFTEEIFEDPSSFTSFPTSTSIRPFPTSTRIFPTSTSTRFFPFSTRIFPTFPTSTSTRFFSTSFPTSTSTRLFPTPTTSTVTPPTTPTVGPPTSCARLTGYPPCSPEVCYGKDSLKRCSITVDTCTERCQVTICGACFYINRPASNKQCSRRSYCKDFNCLLQWINCSYKKSVQSQFICMIAAATDTIRAGGLKLPYGKGGLASDLFTIL